MEASKPLPTIAILRAAHSKGKEWAENPSKIVSKKIFLVRTRLALKAIFGDQAPIVGRYTDAIKGIRSITEAEFSDLLAECERILHYLESLSGLQTANLTSQPSSLPGGRNVFIIHGHDELNTFRLQALLKDHFHLPPVLMKSEPGKGLVLLEKFERAASACVYAFAIMTPDDAIGNQGQPYFQARPNVIFEAGWFVGRLGIPRVCLLLKEGTTVQSDIEGISRIHFRENIEEKVVQIEREVVAAGLLRT